MTPPAGPLADDSVVVVGSGPTGAIAAAQLVARGVKVTMLDAGPAAPRGIILRVGGNTLYRYKDEKLLEADRHEHAPGRPTEWKSSRTLGGLSNYWTAAVPRFAPQDFTEAAAIDERYEWPLRYDDLVPFYEVAEKALTVTMGEPFPNIPTNTARYRCTPPADWADLARRAAASGNYLGPLPMAKGTPWMAALRGTEFGSYHCIIRPLLSTKLFTLVSGAQVTRLNWNSSTARVESVDFVDRATGERRTLHGRAVVLAAGAVDTTTILLRSVSADFPDGLGNSRHVVGRYLHDHPKEWWPVATAQPLSALAHPMYLSRTAFDPERPFYATSMTFGLASHRINTYLRRKTGSFGVQVFGTMLPTPEVGVSLPDDATRNDAECRPRIDLTYEQAAIDNMMAARVRLREVFGELGVTLTLDGPFPPLLPGASIHFGGTVRMHRSPEFGAVDASNRLYDAPNVVVCDSSCFTTGPEKNPTLTAMAIAARAGDLLADSLQ
ncbi:MAG: GMC family oxidoreductase [Actinomycetota bacterium]|nr:GMC family oxidoreductase [Actinomycetota bacterium]